MKPILTHPTREQIVRGCAKLALEIVRNSQTPHVEVIVGLSRGGLFPAIELSEMLNAPMIAINYSSKAGHGDNKNHSNVLPDLNVEPRTVILIVDDITDGGHTLEEVSTYYRKKYEQRGCVIRTAVLYHKVSSIHVPDYAWQTITQDDPWIIFPHEL